MIESPDYNIATAEPPYDGGIIDPLWSSLIGIWIINFLVFIISPVVLYLILTRRNNSIATKLCENLINNQKNIFEIFLVHYTIQWLNCVMHSLNVKTYTENWLRKLMHSF